VEFRDFEGEEGGRDLSRAGLLRAGEGGRRDQVRRGGTGGNEGWREIMHADVLVITVENNEREARDFYWKCGVFCGEADTGTGTKTIPVSLPSSSPTSPVGAIPTSQNLSSSSSRGVGQSALPPWMSAPSPSPAEEEEEGTHCARATENFFCSFCTEGGTQATGFTAAGYDCWPTQPVVYEEGGSSEGSCGNSGGGGGVLLSSIANDESRIDELIRELQTGISDDSTSNDNSNNNSDSSSDDMRKIILDLLKLNIREGKGVEKFPRALSKVMVPNKL